MSDDQKDDHKESTADPETTVDESTEETVSDAIEGTCSEPENSVVADSDGPRRARERTEREIDFFFCKAFYNVLVSIRDEYKMSHGMLINYLASYMNNFPPEFSDYIQEKEKEYEEKHKHDKKNRWFTIYDYIKLEEINDLIAIVEKGCPYVKEDFKITKNVNFIGDLLDLNKNEKLLLQFYSYLEDVSGDIERIWDIFSFAVNDAAQQASVAFGLDPKETKKILSGHTNLLNSGLLTALEHGDFRNHYGVIQKVQDLIDADNLTHELIEQKLFPSNLDTSLTLDDYYQQDEIKILTDIINKCLANKRSGINSLLWGIPGTGKTELPLVLAEKYGWDLRVIGDISDYEDEEKGRAERLLSLKIAQKLFRNQSDKKIVLLFDEMEDLFKLDLNANFSKAFINRLIEKTKIPIIWTTNNLLDLGSAVLRRMTYSIEFKVPPAKFRRKIWEKYISEYSLTVNEEVRDNLATNFDVVPALIANTAKVAHLSDLKDETIEQVLANLDTVMHMGNERSLDRKKDPKYEFEIELSNADCPLEKLVDSILNAKTRNFSICLYGPPGTGKSAFARYLAKQLKMKVLYKRASDLQSMWLGETEKNIAKMFKNGRDDEQFIILDEADSFLHSRKNAIRGWEVSQINEMLSQMEMHQQPFVCSTNLMETLDEAALRRFTFKIKFDFLREDQLIDMFKFYFGSNPPADILGLDILTPGDFANVKKKVTYLDITDPNEIYEMLVTECKFKPQYSNPTGFTFHNLKANETGGEVTPKKATEDVAAHKRSGT